MSASASAPGKMMLSGEYAVLEGAPALVAAVQARATATIGPAPADDPHVARDLDHAEPRYPEAARTRRLAEKELGEQAGALRIDVEALRKAGRKLGLGSSAAAAAAAAGAVFVGVGRDPQDAVSRARILSLALEGHRAVSPNGSGADVAAAVLGGVVRFRLDPATREADARDGSWPEGLVARVAWTGQAASTRELIGRVHALRDRDAAAYQAAMQRLHDESAHFAAAFQESPAAIVEAAARYHEAMDALGRAADAPIVEGRLRKVAELAAAAGGRAKPSGAGGGDVAIAFFTSDEAAADFEARCAAAEYDVLALELGGPGVKMSSAR
ncbi:MAG: hypothetical protein CMN31_27055 [Sandaracinus sp.]|nr:hypothetical protein [Myxococcales bacterium]MAT25568.1 hypothetical protein [Sandaracinus sp.]HJL05031.1 hypothetical protein [Polyangiaceae bacterium LLY-WYZ-15_(1-7)]MBJ74948.1 hypothetical protein [Sandaracinus sp.]HJL21046.1 hypothetical protein [Polyangiaceae bacterium LLY-WYZ-15_(1-7)]